MQQGTFKSYFGAILIPIIDSGDGTYGGVTHDWAQAMSGMGGGLAVTQLRLHVRNYRVDIAKEKLVEQAIEQNAQYVVFVDDDVIPPGDSLLKMVKLWRKDPKYKIISGIYWSKSDPPHPLIFHGDVSKGELIGSYWDWKTTDLIQCDAGGAGLLFVDIDVFKKMSKPWFSCDYYFEDPRSVLDANKASLLAQINNEMTKGTQANSKQIKEMQKQIDELNKQIDASASGKMDPNLLLNQRADGATTEDLYFFKKAKEELGIRPWFDCSIQAMHQDKRSGRMFGINPNMPQAKPRFNGKMEPGDDVVVDIGAGSGDYFIKEGKAIRVDLDPKCNPDIVADARSIPLPDCFADMAFASHILEHFSFREVVGVIKEWARIVKVGGRLVIVVPNLKWASQRILEETKNMEMAKRAMYMYFSAQKGDMKEAYEDYHKSGYTLKSMQGLISRIKGLKVTKIVTSEGNIDNWDDPELLHDKDDLGYNILCFIEKEKHIGPISLRLGIAEQEAILGQLVKKGKLDKKKAKVKPKKKGKKDGNTTRKRKV